MYHRLMSKKRRQIAGRTAVVTGAGSGIGRALAQRLAGHGCPVAICDANEDDLTATAETIGGAAAALPATLMSKPCFSGK